MREILVDENSEPYGCTIVMDRYSGVYSEAKWLAFPLFRWNLPEGFDGGDIECMEFWENYEEVVGKGDSPEDAYKHLLDKLK